MSALRCACGHWLHDHTARRIGNPPSGYTYTGCRGCLCARFENEQGQRFEQGELTKAREPVVSPGAFGEFPEGY